VEITMNPLECLIRLMGLMGLMVINLINPNNPINPTNNLINPNNPINPTNNKRILLKKQEIGLNQKGEGKGLIVLIKRLRPLDSKSVVCYAKPLDIKGFTMTLKMGLSTFMTPLK